MKCAVCGYDVPEGKEYCPLCGTRMEPAEPQPSVIADDEPMFRNTSEPERRFDPAKDDAVFDWNTYDFPKPQGFRDITMDWSSADFSEAVERAAREMDRRAGKEPAESPAEAENAASAAPAVPARPAIPAEPAAPVRPAVPAETAPEQPEERPITEQTKAVAPELQPAEPERHARPEAPRFGLDEDGPRLTIPDFSLPPITSNARSGMEKVIAPFDEPAAQPDLAAPLRENADSPKEPAPQDDVRIAHKGGLSVSFPWDEKPADAPKGALDRGTREFNFEPEPFDFGKTKIYEHSASDWLPASESDKESAQQAPAQESAKTAAASPAAHAPASDAPVAPVSTVPAAPASAPADSAPEAPKTAPAESRWNPSSLKKEDDEDVSEGWLKGQISYRKDPYYSRSEEPDLSDLSERSPEQFFTFNRKNEEFQKLLDAEYERLMSVRKGFEAPEPVKPEPPAPSNVDFSGSGDDLESKLDALFGPVGGNGSRNAVSASESRAKAPKAEPFAPLEPAPWDVPKDEPSAAEPVKAVPAEPVNTAVAAEQPKSISATEPVKTVPAAEPVNTIPAAEPVKSAPEEDPAKAAPAAEPAKAEPAEVPGKEAAEAAPSETVRFVQPPASGDRSRMGDEDLITALFGEIPEDRKHIPPAFTEKPEPAPEPEPAQTPEQELEAKTRSFREELSAGEKRLDTLEARLERLQREVEARRMRAAEEAKGRAESAQGRVESAAGGSEALKGAAVAAGAAAAAASVQAAEAATAARESAQTGNDPFSDPWKQPFSTAQKYYENSGIRAEVPEDAAKGEAGRAFDQLIEAAAAAAGRKPFESLQEQPAEEKPAEASPVPAEVQPEPAYTELKPATAYTELKPEPIAPASEEPAPSEPVQPEAKIEASAPKKPGRDEYEFSYRQKDTAADAAAASMAAPAEEPASGEPVQPDVKAEAAAPAPEAEEQPKDNFEKFFEGHEEPEEGKKHPVLAALLVLALLLGLLKGSSWALGRFLPDAGITQTVSALDDSVSGAFSSAKSSVMSLLGKEEAPDLSATGGVDLQALLSEYNRNIKSVSVDLEKLALTENTECGIETLADSEKIEDPALLTEAYKTMILYNSSWIDYVNKGDETTLSYMKADGAAYRGAVNFDRESVGTETFGEMVLGEVRKAGEELYVFVRESITVSKDNKNRNASYDWVYILEKVGEEYKVVDCKAFK